MKNKKLPAAGIPETEKVSEAQLKFEQTEKKHQKLVKICRLLVLLLFLGVWEAAADLGLIDSFFFSSPSRVILCFVDMLQTKSLFIHIGITLFETVVSFLLVIIISILAATLLWYSRRLHEIAEPYLVVLNSLPKSALAPLLIVWLGTGIDTIIVAGMSVAIFGAIISLYTGFLQVDEEKIRLVKTLGGTKKDTFFKVVLPGSVPTILSTMKVNIGLALVGVIIGEFLSARRGLGYLIIYSSQVFKLDILITSILILCVIAMGLYQLVQLAERIYQKRL